MEFPKKQLLVVGDRVLITPEEGEDRSRVGLYLPASALEGQQVQAGLIVATGPGEPMPDFSALDEEPWKASRREGVRQIPSDEVQLAEGTEGHDRGLPSAVQPGQAEGLLQGEPAGV